MTNKQATKAMKTGEIDMKDMKMGKDRIQPSSKKRNFWKDLDSNMETIKYAGMTVFYLILGISLMVSAGTAIYASYKVDMYEPLTYIVKFSGFFVGLCAFVPLGKAVVKR